MVFVASACGEGSNEMYAWPRQGFRFFHIQSMQVEEDPKQLLDT